jgi:hypothetical protein
VQWSNDVAIIETRKLSMKDPFEATAIEAVQDILDRIPDSVDAASGMLPASATDKERAETESAD